MKVLNNGEIEFGGGTVAFLPSGYRSNAVSDANFALARLNSSGNLDSSFGTGGIVRAPFQSAESILGLDPYDANGVLPNAFEARADGSAILAGVPASQSPDNSHTTIALVNASGIITFNGIVPSDQLARSNVLQALALPDGRAVLMRNNASITDGLALTEVFADGSTGPTVLTNDLNPATDDIITDAALGLAANGQLLLSGYESASNHSYVQQINATTANAPRPDNFPHAGATSIDEALSEKIYVAYYDTASRNLKFARRLENGQWSAPITVDTHVGAGTYLSVRSDNGGEPVIAYYDSRTRTLKAAVSTNEGRTFTLKTIDASPGVGQSVTGVLNIGTGSVNFAYRDATNGDLKLATYNHVGRFSTTVVDGSKDNVGQQIAITDAYNSQTLVYHVMIAYYDATAGEVKYAGQTSKGFTIKNVAPAPNGVESLAIETTETDMPAIAFHDLGTDEVRLSVYRKGPRFETHTIANHTGQAIELLLSDASDDPDVLIYSKYTKRLSMLVDPLRDRDVFTTLSGGAYLDALWDVGYDLAALVNPSGTLEVRDLPLP